MDSRWSVMEGARMGARARSCGAKPPRSGGNPRRLACGRPWPMAALLAVAWALCGPLAAARASSVVVSPANMNGWGFVDDLTDLPIAGAFTPGPMTPPLENGSAELAVDSTGREILGTQAYSGTRLDQISALTYSAYRTSGTTALAVSLQFDIDYDLTDAITSYQGRLVFEPYLVGSPATGVWQSWNALPGKWWGSKPPGSTLCPQSAPCTWSQVLANWPDAGVWVGGNVLFKAGGPWAGGFDGNVDAFTITTGAGSTTFDFEPCSATPEYVSPGGDDTANDCTNGATPCATIQHAIDVGYCLGTINVRPGTYNETAPISSPPGCSGDTVGLYIPDAKTGMTIQGVDGSDVPVTSSGAVLATVNTVSNLCFGPDGFFVEADGVTISGIRVGTNTGGQNKTIEVIGDDFTLKSCDIADVDGSVYINDFRFDTIDNLSHVQGYTIQGNNFQDGVSIDLASGAGFSGAPSGRQILGNTFANSQSWPSISFNGSGTGVPWFTYSVGGAVIQGNNFDDTNSAGQPIRARGTYDNSQFDWASYWNDNTFNKAVVVGTAPPADVRTYSYTSGPYTFNDVRRIGNAIQPEADHGQAADTVLVAPGTYDESPHLSQSLTLRSASGRDLTTINLQTGPTYLGSLELSGAGNDFTVDGFTIAGLDASCPTLATTNVYLDPDLHDVVLKNNRFRVGAAGACSNGDDGFGVITTYSETSDVNSLTVSDSLFEPLHTEGTRAFYINPGVLDFAFQRNQITGKFGRSLTQAKNGLVEDNTVDGQGLGGNGLGSWGYPDADVWGHTTFRQNDFSGLGTALSIFESNDVIVECNRFSMNGTGVGIFDGYGTANFDPTSIDIHTSSFLDNSSSAVDNSAGTAGTVFAQNNWWGCVAGPGNAGCDTVNGDVDYTSEASSPPPCVSCTANADCDDGLTCTGAESCNTISGMCQAGTPVDCSGLADQCNTAACEEPGTCVVTPRIDGYGCNDGNLCTMTDVCQSGVCVGSNGGDADGDGYCDAQEQQAGCNPNDGAEIPPQPNVYSGNRRARGGEILLTFNTPGDRRISPGTDPSCSLSGVCSNLNHFCTRGRSATRAAPTATAINPPAPVGSSSTMPTQPT